MFDTMMVSVGDAPGSDGVLALASRLAARCHAHGGVVLVGGTAVSPAEDLDPIAFEWSRVQAPASWPEGGSEIAFEDRSKPLIILTRSAESIAELTDRPLPAAPVLLLGAEAADGPWFVDRHPRILVVVEREPDPSLLASAFAFSQATDGHLTLVTVAGGAEHLAGEPPPALRMVAAQRRLDRLAAELRDGGASVASLVVTSSDPERALPDLVEHGRFDVAAIPAVTADGTRRLGPLAAALVRKVSKPILIG